MGLATVLIVAGVSPLWAVSSYHLQSTTGKMNRYEIDALFTGGKASGGTSLLNVRRLFSQKARIERVTIEVGDKDLKPAGKNIGYYQVSLESKDNRVVVDLSQLKQSRVSEAAVQNLFRRSQYVASVGLTLDPEDKNATLVLNMKSPVKVEVFQILKEHQPGKIVMDISPR